MKSLFDKAAGNEILSRVEKIQPESTRQWGKMSVSQMMAHCSAQLQTAVGDSKPKRSLYGRLIGPLVRGLVSNEKPFFKNSPTDPSFVVKENNRVFAKEKTMLSGLIKRFIEGGNSGVTVHPHPFFGKLKAEEWGTLTYKHLDHHLRQFGV
jgi:hypothetical protein